MNIVGNHQAWEWRC